MKQKLYIWNWTSGGYNQTYAINKAAALKQAKEIWSGSTVDMSTFKRLNADQERAYWRNFPLMD